MLDIMFVFNVDTYNILKLFSPPNAFFPIWFNP